MSTKKTKGRGYPEHRVHKPQPSPETVEWVIWAAWSDRFTFESIERLTNLSEKQVIALMQRHQTASTFRRWRRRVRKGGLKHGRRFKLHRRQGRFAKHQADLRGEEPV